VARRTALIVAGPTASGKSALALTLAERIGGTVINADSMQVYRELRVLSARPSVAEEARAPHALYGVRPAGEPGNVAWWRSAALAAMAAAAGLPILCGGTGLYLAALTRGLAVMPDPGAAARAEARALLSELGPARLHQRLAEVDPLTAGRLKPHDSQRIARAWEVWRGTGRPLSSWLAASAAAGERPDSAPWRFAGVLLEPPREALRAAIARRLERMLGAGALEEVRGLLALGLDPRLPAMRAHGVPELAAHLRREITLDEAARRVRLATGQYAKRQGTWFRHHAIGDRMRIFRTLYTDNAQFSSTWVADLLNFVRASG
jgi:tRNA dimethylallyltransferase